MSMTGTDFMRRRLTGNTWHAHAVDSYELQPVGRVVGGRTEVLDDDWGQVEAVVRLDAERFEPDVLAGLDDFSHVEVVFLFDRLDEKTVNLTARHPRNNPEWPLVGIFAQRAKGRPNRLGITTCEVRAVQGLDVFVRGLDAVDGTPVLDLKPYMREFAPRSRVRQPAWVGELMRGYWESEDA